MSKTKFEDEDTANANLREMLNAANGRAERDQEALNEIRTRIGTFYGRIQHVVFASRQGAPEWAHAWHSYLMTGAILNTPVDIPADFFTPPTGEVKVASEDGELTIEGEVGLMHIHAGNPDDSA